MASAASTIERRMREARAETDREIREIRERSDRTVEAIRSEAQAKEREMQRQLADLERRQAEAARRTEETIARELRRQRDETAGKLNALRLDTERRLHEQSEQMRRLWREAYERLERKLREIEQRTEAILRSEMDHARESIKQARTQLEGAMHDEELQRFNREGLHLIEGLFNDAVSAFKRHLFVPADGQAMLVQVEIRRARSEAEQRRLIWQRTYDDAKQEWDERRRALKAMDEVERIEAADLALDGTGLSYWNSDACDAHRARLDSILRILDRQPYCPPEEIAVQMIYLQQMRRDIADTRLIALSHAVRYLYMVCLAEEMASLILDDRSAWRETAREDELTQNIMRMVIGGPLDDGQILQIELRELENGAIRVAWEDSSYDRASERRRQHARWRQLLMDRMDGTEAAAMSFGDSSEYANGDAVCMVFLATIPDGVLPEHGSIIASMEEPQDEPAQGANSKKEVATQ